MFRINREAGFIAMEVLCMNHDAMDEPTYICK
jgi:hypothetical protein